MDTFYTLIEATALALALSADALTAGFTYGASRVKIPFVSALTVGVIGSGVLAFSLFAGTLGAAVVPPSVGRWLSFAILAVLGLVKLAGMEEHASPYCDADRNKVLSLSEACALAAALSLDSLAAGFSSGMTGAGVWAAVLLTLAFTTGAVLLGARCGNALPVQAKYLRYLGLVFILLAVCKIL